jgi:hypothetical protein
MPDIHVLVKFQTFLISSISNRLLVFDFDEFSEGVLQRKKLPSDAFDQACGII